MSVVKLRDYQRVLVEQIEKAWNEGNRRVLAQLATGGGKSIIASSLALKFAQEGYGVIFIAHRLELIEQAKDHLERMTQLPVKVIGAGKPIDYQADIWSASIQTLWRRDPMPDAQLVIADEAHRCASKSWRTVLDQYPEAKILGLSATPYRPDGQGLKRVFDTLVSGISCLELIKDGHLCNYRIFAPMAKIDTQTCRVTQGEFDQEDLANLVRNQVFKEIVPTWEKYASGKKTLVFAATIDLCREIAELYNDAGIPAAYLDGTHSKKVRKSVMEQFRNGELTVLINCGLFTEGLDVPGIEALQCLRPTKSLVLWLQMVGRSLRPAPGKDHAIIIDHSDNCQNHGLPDDTREWSLDPVCIRRGIGTKECPQCNHIFRPLSHESSNPLNTWVTRNPVTGETSTKHEFECTCPVCDTKFTYQEQVGNGIPGDEETRSPAKVDGEMVELDLTPSPKHMAYIDSLVASQQASGRRKGWVYYQLKDHPDYYEFNLGTWRYVAQKLGYQTGWAYHRHTEAQAAKVEGLHKVDETPDDSTPPSPASNKVIDLSRIEGLNGSSKPSPRPRNSRSRRVFTQEDGSNAIMSRTPDVVKPSVV